MSPNLRPGKTCLMLSLIGKGKEKARRRFFSDGAQSLCLPDLGVRVPVADQYKHLGGYDGYVDSLSMLPEVRHRLAQAHSSFEASKTPLLNNSELSISTQAAIFASAITPTFFNIGQWLPTGQAWNKLDVGYSKLVRRLLAKEAGGDLLFHVPLALAHYPCPLKSAQVPGGLRPTAQDEQHWMHLVQQDLHWLVAGSDSDWPPVHVHPGHYGCSR